MSHDKSISGNNNLWFALGLIISIAWAGWVLVWGTIINAVAETLIPESYTTHPHAAWFMACTPLVMVVGWRFLGKRLRTAASVVWVASCLALFLATGVIDHYVEDLPFFILAFAPLILYTFFTALQAIRKVLD